MRFVRLINLLLAVLCVAALLFVSMRGAGPAPPLGPALVPGTGVWTLAADASLPRSGSFRLAGLKHAVRITFERTGTAHVEAQDDNDLLLADGYLHGTFRLFQMDLMRRQGEGRLAEVFGAAALPSDRFELQLGLLRTAQAEWRALSPSDPARADLLAYARGVNDAIAARERSHTLPVLFKAVGYAPKPWSPIDTLVIQGDMTQDLDFTDTPLDAALLVRHLGYTRFLHWFPVLPADLQHPYDPGPYHRHALTPPGTPAAGGVAAILSAARELAALPPGEVHVGSNSNNWAVTGPKTATGRALLAGDPHLHMTLPSIWYQLSLDDPGMHVMGVGIPGTPGILIGHNGHIAWSLTNTENQATFFYLERMDRSHPSRYFWRGAWRPLRKLHYTIPVKGSAAQHLTVSLTVHGPLIGDDRLKGDHIAVDWMGNLPSPDLAVVLAIDRAATYAQFRGALRAWRAPTQNFIYADNRNNIGFISAGAYPILKRGVPWLPLPGDGTHDIAGYIPYRDIPQAYDPKSHFLFTANQRPVGPTYPYYIGTSLDFFENGFRANRIYTVLSSGRRLTAGDMERLQNDVHDYLAMRMTPALLRALRGQSLTATQFTARAALAAWDGTMTGSSSAASIWWEFLTRYLQDTFGPWWAALHVPSHKFPSLQIDPTQQSLVEDLDAWTQRDRRNPAFDLPNGTHRTAPAVMRQAFREAVTTLSRRYGSHLSSWHWGRMHRRLIESLALIPSLQYGPRGSGGDDWTVDAADSGSTATAGPSWRFVMDWSTGRGYGVYPGGQSESPVSPWYKNQIATWWKGAYYPMLTASEARAKRGSISWEMRP